MIFAYEIMISKGRTQGTQPKPRIWNLQRSDPIASLEGHSAVVLSALCFPNGRGCPVLCSVAIENGRFGVAQPLDGYWILSGFLGDPNLWQCPWQQWWNPMAVDSSSLGVAKMWMVPLWWRLSIFESSSVRRTLISLVFEGQTMVSG